MVVIDDYRKGWALRYLREAKDELKTSIKISNSFNLIIDAARKAQAAIYFALGDPSSIEGIINELSLSAEPVENPVLRCLVEIEQSLRRIESFPPTRYKEALKEADEIVQIASGIVELMTSED